MNRIMLWWRLRQLRSKNEGTRERAAEELSTSGDLRVVEPLVAALKDEERSVRETAAQVLGRIGEPRVVELLVAVLKDEDRRVRKEAARVLGQIRDQQAVEPLVAALRDEDRYVREEAARALGQIGDRQAVEPLIAALKDKDIRKDAVWALRLIRDPRAVEPLVKVLNDRKSSVRSEAARTLELLGWRPLNTSQRALKAVACRQWDDAASLGIAAIDPLVTAAQDQDKDIRLKAVEALGQIGGEHVVGPLVEALEDRERSVRKEAARALGQIGDPRAVKPLVTVLKYEAPPYPSNEELKTTREVLEVLFERAAANVALDDLRAIVSLKDKKETIYGRGEWVPRNRKYVYEDGYSRAWESGDDPGGYFEEKAVGERTVVSYSRLRQLAQQELLRRGLDV